MKKLIVTLAFALAVGCDNPALLSMKGDGGELIYRKHGACYFHGRSSMDSAFIRSHHYREGTVYGIKLMTGKLVPPGEKGEPDVTKIVWMCRFHIAEWIGVDPETGRRAEWMK